MSDVTGVAISEVTAFGWSDDGKHIWITHKLRDGSEYRLVYPLAAAGHLIAMFGHAARSAAALRAAGSPQEAVEGMDCDVIVIEQIRIGTAPKDSGAILHLTTVDNVPIAIEMPTALLRDVADQSQRVLERL